MTSLHGITRHTAQGTEFISRQTTETTAHWTCDKGAALKTNSRLWAAKMAARFGGVETTLRGTLADRVVERPPRQVIVMAPYIHDDVERQIADAWGARDYDAFARSLGHAVRRGSVVVQ